MKKILIALTVLTTPFLCLGMQEPFGSGTNERNFRTFESAGYGIKTNRPFLYALTDVSKNSGASNEALLSLSQLSLPLKTYTELASQLCPTCNDAATLAKTIGYVACYSNARVEKTHFLLQENKEKITQEILNQAMNFFLEHASLFTQYDPKYNETHATTLKELWTSGAEISPETASAALQRLIADNKNIYTYPYIDLCNPERRAIMRFLTEHGAHFDACTKCGSSCAYCDAALTSAP
ncbi:hypothetical protein, partial [Methylicorpusculum sp.]|uniref:hypothetical protein n=1 Tax=Methylicorpusculum sp. TaxID=2713644 RepID=UPI002ABA43A1